jgi:hypothetical protein
VASTGSVLILHFPIRSREQIKLKVLNGVEARNNAEELAGKTSVHWGKIHEKIVSGDFDQWLDDLLAKSESMKNNPRKSVQDYRLRDYMLNLTRESKSILPF